MPHPRNFRMIRITPVGQILRMGTRWISDLRIKIVITENPLAVTALGLEFLCPSICMGMARTGHFIYVTCNAKLAMRISKPLPAATAQLLVRPGPANTYKDRRLQLRRFAHPSWPLSCSFLSAPLLQTLGRTYVYGQATRATLAS